MCDDPMRRGWLPAVLRWREPGTMGAGPAGWGDVSVAARFVWHVPRRPGIINALMRYDNQWLNPIIKLVLMPTEDSISKNLTDGLIDWKKYG